MKSYGVIGHPIAHSLSPLMHNAAFKVLGLEATYGAFDVEPASLRRSLEVFKSKGFAGLNITIPLKEDMLALAEEVTEEARAIGAVNTVLFRDGKVFGFNTDAFGISKSLEEFRGELAARNMLVLGAGGSARAVVYTLLNDFSPNELIVASRTVKRADELASRFVPSEASKIRTLDLQDPAFADTFKSCTLIVNCTPVGMSPNVEASPLGDPALIHSKQIVMDLIYTPLKTTLLAAADKVGARTISGVEMLLQQGARSFEIWTERQMPVDQIRPVLLRALEDRGKGDPNS
ncbi:MAG TPA: shikimate dehydrogenase [Bacteroidetes bacterium]|nr:shikimate dehydrogenase [Bacteroidota bacterium]